MHRPTLNMVWIPSYFNSLIQNNYTKNKFYNKEHIPYSDNKLGMKSMLENTSEDCDKPRWHEKAGIYIFFLFLQKQFNQ